MPDPQPRRRFLRDTLLGAAAGAGLAGTPPVEAAAAQVQAEPPAYTFLTPAEAGFVEALVDHMVPADRHSPQGTAIGINVYFDRALGGNWGQGDRLYTQGPWKQGLPGQGYQLALVPAELFRIGAQALEAHLQRTYGKAYAQLPDDQKEAVLHALEKNTIAFDNGIRPSQFFALLYQLVMEGLFADPAYGGNAGKAGWKLIGFPGVIATHAVNIVKFKNRPYPVTPVSIADAS